MNGAHSLIRGERDAATRYVTPSSSFALDAKVPKAGLRGPPVRPPVEPLPRRREGPEGRLARAAGREKAALPRLRAAVADDEPAEHLDELVRRRHPQPDPRVRRLLRPRDAEADLGARLLAILRDPDRNAAVVPRLEPRTE